VIHRYRRLWLLVGVLAGLLVTPAGALAAIDNDAVLTVQFTDAVTLLPVDGAAVHVIARQGDQVLGEFDATTDADGTAAVSALPRETGEGDAVTLDVRATKSTSFTDPDTGCTLSDSWYAERLGVVVDSAAVGVAFTEDEQAPGSSLACPPSEAPPTGEVGGAVGTPGSAAHTIPPTDTVAEPARASTGAGLAALAVTVLAAGILLLTPRRRRAEVRVERRARR
jgi:hypothetical protein